MTNLHDSAHDPQWAITWEVTADYAGQVNERGIARRVVHDGSGAPGRHEGPCEGHIDTALFGGIPSIQHILVSPSCPRQGVASALVRDLQSRFPDTEIQWGGTTPDGAALRDSLPCRSIENPTVVALQETLASAVEVRTAYEQKDAAFDALLSPTLLEVEAHRAWRLATGEKWNDVHDQIWALEAQLSSGPAAVQRIILDEAAANLLDRSLRAKAQALMLIDATAESSSTLRFAVA